MVFESEEFELLSVTTANTMPCKLSGIVTVLLSVSGSNVEFNPDKNATNSVPFEEDVELVALNESVDDWPGVGVPSNVSAGKAENGSVGFDAGQEVMKLEASVKTWFPPSGVSNAPLHGACFITEDEIQPL